MISQNNAQVLSIRNLSKDSYVLRFSKNEISFRPGQFVTIGSDKDREMREYSLYSRSRDPFSEVLIKEVKEGLVSVKLRHLQKGDSIFVQGPFGYFLIPENWADLRFVFIATGTGIAPFHSIIGSYPGIHYQLIHGIPTHSERYEHDVYDTKKLIACISREETTSFKGRVTDYLRSHEIDAQAYFYLCGSCDMIYEVYDILQENSIPSRHIFAEVYY